MRQLLVFVERASRKKGGKHGLVLIVGCRLMIGHNFRRSTRSANHSTKLFKWAGRRDRAIISFYQCNMSILIYTAIVQYNAPTQIRNFCVLQSQQQPAKLCLALLCFTPTKVGCGRNLWSKTILIQKAADI